MSSTFRSCGEVKERIERYNIGTDRERIIYYYDGPVCNGNVDAILKIYCEVKKPGEARKAVLHWSSSGTLHENGELTIAQALRDAASLAVSRLKDMKKEGVTV